MLFAGLYSARDLGAGSQHVVDRADQHAATGHQGLQVDGWQRARYQHSVRCHVSGPLGS